MIAGPNGAGKTTSAFKLLPGFLSIYEFINADQIAYGLNPLNAKDQSLAAGRIMLKRIDELIANSKSFAFETTAASSIFAAKLKRAKLKGYSIGLIYLWLPNVDLAISRVALRVSQGGHDIPPADISRRYTRGLHNMVHLYFPMADHAVIYDNSLVAAPRLIASKAGEDLSVLAPELWDKITSG